MTFARQLALLILKLFSHLEAEIFVTLPFLRLVVFRPIHILLGSFNQLSRSLTVFKLMIFGVVSINLQLTSSCRP